MTLLLRDYHGHAHDATSPDDAGHWFDEQTQTIMPHGGCGQTLTIGTHDTPVLRIDIDIDADRAAVQWLPDGSYATEHEPDTPITVYESPDTGLIDISPELARVTPATARAALIEYAATRQRPTNIDWSHRDQSPNDPL
ncbi:Imm1 family immunity protein [Verrucosispora sp. WMMC514]|uniref:Imm1 family immunity protein n=1 Tax=Verrucosispora sp. WMMC514 TaxID=3015156 RepID=UPI00248B431F|nr:Imm1 family immunity protein [Verrucosispora sp. WMMC514]WBB91540.1 Imm1 family immunity protein [Verrucosispora sp. WMMC514]